MESTVETSAAQVSPNTATLVPAHESGPSAGSAAAAPASASCPTCAGAGGSASRTLVYALGLVEPRFSSPGIEKEFKQAVKGSAAVNLTDRQTLQTVLAKREYRYLTRQLCWVFSIQGLETYLLTPRDPLDLELLVEAAHGPGTAPWLSLVIGVRGPIAPAEMCNGLLLPIVGVDQIYSFEREHLISAIPKPPGAKDKEFAASASELFDRIIQMTDNAGVTPEHRALNYLAVRYPAIYAHASSCLARNCSISAVEVRRSALANTRNIVEVIFSATNRDSDVTDKSFVRVDVTEEFPFLVTKLSPYYDR
jgi:hypothetical protein